MTNPHAQRLHLPTLVVPGPERARYVEEWQADLSRARDDRDRSAVVRGALQVALSRRARWWGAALAGRRGVPAAVVGWAAVGAALVLGWTMGGALGVMAMIGLAVAVACLPRAAILGEAGLGLAIGGALAAVIGLGYFLWAFGARVDAADAGTSEPAAARWGGPGLVVAALGAVTFVGTLVVAARRRPSH